MYNHQNWRFRGIISKFKHFLKNFGRKKFWGDWAEISPVVQKKAIFWPFSTNVANLWTKCCRLKNFSKTRPGYAKVFKNTRIIPRNQVKLEKSQFQKKNVSAQPANGGRPLTKIGAPHSVLNPH